MHIFSLLLLSFIVIQSLNGFTYTIFAKIKDKAAPQATTPSKPNKRLPRETIQNIKQLITEAIHQGSDLYNQGQFKACTALYDITLRSIELFYPAWHYHAKIRTIRQKSAQQNAKKAAWTLRYLLDEIYQYQITEKNKMTAFTLDFKHIDMWYSINDNVMGGISKGAMQQSQSKIGIFTGQLSLANRGGFSSTRLKLPIQSLQAHQGIQLRVKGDPRRYTLLVSTAQTRGSWQKDFVTTGEWQNISIGLTEMSLSIRGWTPADAPPVQAHMIDTIGLMIKDKNERPFRLEIEWIRGLIENK